MPLSPMQASCADGPASSVGSDLRTQRREVTQGVGFDRLEHRRRCRPAEQPDRLGCGREFESKAPHEAAADVEVEMRRESGNEAASGYAHYGVRAKLALLAGEWKAAERLLASA